MSITRINKFKAAEGKERDLFDFLHSLTTYITSSEGCISYEVLQNSDELSNFAIIEKWETIDSHKNSVANFPQDKMLAAMPLFGGAPSGSYYRTDSQ
jgi:quinol monooxygenase YgiN